jgi:ATP-dependent protease ClpP protease subunit
VEEIQNAIERDCWMTPQEALEFGIVDRVVSSSSQEATPL